MAGGVVGEVGVVGAGGVFTGEGVDLFDAGEDAELLAEVADAENLEEVFRSKAGHEEITRQIRQIFAPCFEEILALSGDSCSLCERCSYPEGPCRRPEAMLPCIEGYGIVVPALAEKAGISFLNQGNLVTWFGLLLLKEKEEDAVC